MSADGTFIRAFIESEVVSRFSRPESAPYPGYLQANRTDHKYPAGASDSSYLTLDNGYSTRWVMSVEEHADNTVTAFVCSYTPFDPMEKDIEVLSGLTLVYHRTGTPPPVNQKGPARAPAVSVFGDWYATYYGWNGDMRAEDQRCIERQPVRDKSPVSTPGWPAQAV